MANKRVYYSDMEPSAEVMGSFIARGDNQIMSLELLSIAFGLSVFEDLLKNQNVHVHSDNTGAQHTTSKGIARSFDHTCLIHSMWTRAIELNMHMYVGRVPTKDNISDDPSRERYVLLDRVKAIRLAPWLHPTFASAQSWAALSLVQRQPRLSAEDEVNS